MWASPKFEAGLASVIIPTYNRASVLLDAMESVFNQAYRPVELVIVDDGSTDSTTEVVACFLKETSGDDRFTVQYLAKTNEGCQAARNAGVRVSRGEFLQFLDSDDILTDQKLANAISLYNQNPTLDLVYSRWLVDNGKRLIEMPGPMPAGVSLLSEAVIHNPCIFSPVYRRKHILRVGPFNENLHEAHDVEYSTRVVQQTNTAARDDTIGGVYRIGKTENSITGSVDPHTLRSKWKVNRWQKGLLQDEPWSEPRDRALQCLSRRAHSIATQSVTAGCPSLGLQIMLTEHKLWWPLAPRRTARSVLLISNLLIEYARQIVFGGR